MHTQIKAALMSITITIFAPGSTLISYAQDMAKTETHAAQGNSDQSQSASTNSASKPDARRSRLDEIVVKAQKREESIQEVPISVSAITDVQIGQSNMETLNDLGKYTPNLKVQSNGIFNHIYIRGLGSGFNEGFDQSVGFFIDDIYYARSHYLIAGLLDVERVEVLRGPQGTLFGKNTVAGAVSVYSGLPSDEFEAEGSATLGKFSLQTYQAMMNIPLWEDRVAIRLAAYFTKRDGFMYNTTVGVDDGAYQLFTGRAKVRFDVTDDLEITLTYLKNRGEIFHGIHTQLSAAANPEWLTLMRSYDPETETDIENFNTATDTPNAGVQDSDDFLAHINYEAFEHSFQLILGTSSYTRDGGVDYDGTPVPMMKALVDQDFEQYSAELRVISPPGTFEYVGGLYYLNNTLTDTTDLNGYFTPDIIAVLLASTAGLSPPPLLVNLLNQLSLIGVPETRSADLYQNTESASAFGQITWHVTQDLSLIIGLRYGIDVKTVEYVQRVDPGLFFQGIAGMENFSSAVKIREREFAPKVSALWSVTEWGNLYANFAQGGKSGGFNALSLKEEATLFDPESANTYEVGIKTEFWNSQARFNVGLFRTDFKNLQINVFNGFDNIVQNAPKAVTQGVEADLIILSDFGLSLFGSFAFLDSFYANFPNGPCQTGSTAGGLLGANDAECDQTGESLTNAPRYQGSLSVNQQISFNKLPFDLVFGGDILFQDDVYLQADSDPLDIQQQQWKFNARVGVISRDQRFSLTLFVQNITNQITRVASQDVPLFTGAHTATVDHPRRWNVNLTAKF